MSTNHSPFAFCTLVLASGLAGQSFVTSPSPKFASVEGSTYAQSFGHRRQARHQMLDGNLRGRAATIKELALRAEAHSTWGVGRTWTRVTVRMSHCDVGVFNRTFTKTHLSTPTTVFDARVSWPTISSTRPTSPGPWSYRFPFRSGYGYSGQLDLCSEFEFAGGTLANASPWTRAESYHLDSWRGGQYSRWVGRTLSQGAGCSDSGNPTTSFVTCYSYTFGDHPPSWGVANTHRVEYVTWGIGKSAVAATALGFESSPITFPGIACQRLFVDLRKPHLLMPGRANPHGTFGWHRMTFPRSTALEGLSFVAQTAWEDTQTKLMKLSSARVSGLTHAPLYRSEKDAKRRSLFNTSLTAKTSSLGGEFSTYNPIVRYRL